MPLRNPFNRKAEGDAREAQARAHLERAGLRHLASNVRYRVGELDLVMQDGATLVFVEVRYRADADFGGALASVTHGKRQRLVRAASSFLASAPRWAPAPCRFDVVAISDEHVEWVRDAFQVDA
jgi:putative endonuclease